MVEKYKLTRAEMNALLRDLRRILKYGDEREFMDVLRKRGIKDENPRFAEIFSAICEAGGPHSKFVNIRQHRFRFGSSQSFQVLLNQGGSSLCGLF